jgi:hypothetical protein
MTLEDMYQELTLKLIHIVKISKLVNKELDYLFYDFVLEKIKINNLLSFYIYLISLYKK